MKTKGFYALMLATMSLGSATGCMSLADRPEDDADQHVDYLIAAERTFEMPRGGLLDSGATIKIWPNGDYVFKGHVHNGEWVPVKYSVTLVVSGDHEREYTFTRQGHMNFNILEGVDDDWHETGNNRALARDYWALGDLRWHVQKSWDLRAIADAIKGAIGTGKDLIAIVGPAL